ncbi:hypothetical protein ACN9MI_08965 [Rhodococcoides fascians]|jgi:hypothetical protein|nr:hypothetical protein [Rhodococcus fascians]WQH30222.1 hypothetical protein U2G91_09930 [Rhodococcus fascians]
MSDNDIENRATFPEPKPRIRFEVVDPPELDDRGRLVFARVWRDR